ncbi:NAD(P)-binding domain-containing protein [Nocardiopsis protaetiae]|uniref:NAD(P)-binding domain-containing protein n=1 Tax=Nocardiopsis protaetiae TaxID=3382270 RepID=UPI00387AC324
MTDTPSTAPATAPSPASAPAPSTAPAVPPAARYGFIGTGEITAALVTGLCTGTGTPPEILLSPRNRDVARGLAERFASVRVCADNQEVLDAVTVVVIAVLPPVAVDVLEELSLRPDHVVVSAVAGLPLHRLAGPAAPARTVVRSIPLPQAAHHGSLTALYPDDADARALFSRVGEVVVPDDEDALEAFSAVTATFAAQLDQLSTIAGWLAGRGVAAGVADAFVARIFAEMGRSLVDSGEPIAALAEAHTTPNGNNERFRAELREAGVPDEVRRALDVILERLRA